MEVEFGRMEAAQRVKSVAASLKSLEDGRSGLDLGGVCERIKAKGEDALGFPTKDVNARGLMQLIVKMLGFMEARLGRDSPPEQRVITKIPFKLFRDVQPEGAVETIVCTALRFKVENNMRKFEWSNADRAEQLTDMLRKVESALRDKGFLPQNRIYITRAVPEGLRPKLRAIVLKRGVIVYTASTATHIIYPDPEGTAALDTEGMDYCRTLSVRDTHALVHWWYYPDCFDSWIPSDEVQGELEEEETPSGPWHVQLRWLQDTEIFNEWMNEIDYEIPEELRTKVIPAPRRNSVNAAESGTIPPPARRAGRRSATTKAEEEGSFTDAGLPEEAAVTLSRSPKSSVRRKVKGRSVDEVSANEEDDTKAVSESRIGEYGGVNSGVDMVNDSREEGSAEAQAMRDVRISSGGLKVRLKLPREGLEDGGGMEGKRRKLIDSEEMDIDGKSGMEEQANGEERETKQEDVDPMPEGANLRADAPPAAPTAVAEEEEQPPRAAVDAEAALANGRPAMRVPATTGDVAAVLPRVPVVIPAYSKWFRSDQIHDIERRAVPEFFSNRFASKTERVYKEYRDFMIDTWRRRPDRYLNVTTVRRHLAGDVCAILRVHAFLEHWGLINHNVDPQTRPQPMVVQPPPPVPLAVQDGSNNLSSAVPKLLLFDDGGPVMRSGSSVVRKAPKLATRREVYAAAAAVEYHCDSCGADCSRMRFHCSTQADMDLCADCHAEGKYPPSISSRDFIQMTAVPNTEGYDAAAWTETETLLLLEALELYQDNWNLVAEHVGSKSKDACVLQFLRLPIEDSFLTDQLANVAVKGKYFDESVSPSGVREFTGQPLPFTDASNPIMTQVAFLASMVPQEVAQAATHAALSKLEEGNFEGTTADMSVEEAIQNGLGDSMASSALSKLQAMTEADGLEDLHAMEGENGPKSSDEPTKREPKQVSDEKAVKAAAAVALAAAAARAKVLADKETEEMNKLFAVIIQTKLNAVEMKMKHFEALENHVRMERDRIERQRQQVRQRHRKRNIQAPKTHPRGEKKAAN